VIASKSSEHTIINTAFRQVHGDKNYELSNLLITFGIRNVLQVVPERELAQDNGVHDLLAGLESPSDFTPRNIEASNISETCQFVKEDFVNISFTGAISTTDVTYNITVMQGLGINSFSVLDSDHNIIASTSGDYGSLNFSVPSRSTFSIKVTVSADSNLDVYSLNGVIISTEEQVQIISKDH
jgi:hypothetical protein